AVEEFPESVLSFLQLIKQRSESAEKLILQDLDSTDSWTVQSKDHPNVDSDYFAQLASMNNEEPEAFKKRVLADLEEEDRKDLLSFKNTNIENVDDRKEDAEPADKLDGTDEVINLCYNEVEESCRQKVQQWEKEEEKREELNRAALNARKAVLEEEMKEQDKKRKNWKKEFDKELLRLNILQQNRIDKIEADLLFERKAFEEQKANAKKCLEELQCRAAVRIQAAFRAHKVYQMHAPILKQKKEERKIKRELQHKMDMERKELEEKIKIKLEEKRRKDEEKKQNEEVTKRRMEEAQRKEILEQEMRQQEYEKKKNAEKIRLEKAKLLKEQEKSKQEKNSPIYSSKNESPAEEGQPKGELDLTLKMAEKTVMKEDEKVTMLTLHDLPGCSLSTLSKCVKLQFLSLRRCGLTTLDGLSNCKALQYIDVQENCISIINCEGLKNLSVLLLNKNQIPSIHGIEECENLMNLELSFNLITRIAGLESLKNLQRLVLDHNQVISTKALETTPLLTYLDCSYNYLSELEGIQNCGLMQILKLQGNNLSEIPILDNHVLMRELYLDDNNLISLTDLSSCWLPLLQVFSISQNSIIHLPPFNTFISLEELNLSSNCLSELKTMSLWLEGCALLRKLSISKNPFLQESNWRLTLQKTLPALRYLNDEELKSEDKIFYKAPSGSFMAFCQHQSSKFSKLWHVVNGEERVPSSLQKLKVYCNTLKEILQLSNVYRYAHEYGNIEDAEREDPEIPRDCVSQLDFGRSQHSSHIINGSHEDECEATKQITFQEAQSLFECSFVNAEQPNQANRGSLKNIPQISTRKGIEEHSREVAAVHIQAQWRGYVIRRDIRYYAKLHEAASIIQSAWHHYNSRKKYLHKKSTGSKTSEVKQHAATVIQAAWKGFFLRKKLAAAFAGIDREELEDHFEEVNLDEFTFDDTVFEKGWSVDSTLPHSEALHLFSKPERPKKYGPEEDQECSSPWFPQEAWAGSESSVLNRRHRHKKDTNQTKKWLEKQNLSHVYSMKSNTDVSFKLEKEEKISQEWGFKEASTAQLMLKRAQKMKCKQAKHKKMLDPAVRLALFKNNENKHAPVMPPKKAQPIKIEYFRGKEEELCHLRELPSEPLARSRELTYQWLHTQCGDVNLTNSPMSKRFLPELKHDVLNGGRVQLVTNDPLSKEADDLDLLSVKSGSIFSQNREEKVRTGSSGTSSNRNVFVPEKNDYGPQRKERISFRDNPMQFSTGWGGGKKKGKVIK
ncbi:hypothetical protein GDO78_006014, partial [Eleutherodactylus coqui]